VYDGQRRRGADQRVFILTRSAFAGSQRYGAANVVGASDYVYVDRHGDNRFRPAWGLSISGVPYWTQDAGGYTMQNKFSARNPKPEDEEEWRELNARWFDSARSRPLLAQSTAN